MIQFQFDWASLAPWVDLAAQSSVLLALVLLIGRFVIRGSAARNALYRAGIAALLLLPLMGLGSGLMGARWRPMPARPAAQPAQLTPAYRVGAVENVAQPPPAARVNAAPLISPVVAHSPAPISAAPQPHGMPRVVNLPGLLWLVWAAGTAFMLLRLAVGLTSLRALLRKAAPVREPQLHESLRRVCDLLRIHAPRLVRSPSCRSPFLAGVREAVILLPERLPPVDPEKVLAHEAAHLARGDCRWTLLGELARALFFWQPLAWLLARGLTESADLAADNAVLELGGEAKEYASQLAALAGCRFEKGKGVEVMGATGFASSLRRRVKGLLSAEKDRTVTLRRSRATALTAVALGCALLTACFSLRAKEAPSARAQAAPMATDKGVAGNEKAQEEAIRALLQKRSKGMVIFPSVSVREALEILKSQLYSEAPEPFFNLLVDSAVLADDRNIVMLDVKAGTPFSQMFDLVLKPVGLDYAIEGNTVHISTAERLRQKASASDEAVQALLRWHVPAVSLPGIPLQEAIAIVMAQLREHTVTVNFFIDPNLLMNTDILVTLDVKDVPLSQVLDMMLKPKGLDYMVQGNTIYISTIEGVIAARPVELRVYDVSDFRDRKEFLLRTIVAVTGQEMWVYVPDLHNPPPHPEGVVVASGRSLIFDPMTGLMAVNNSEPVHRKVAEILQTLRQATPAERTKSYAPVGEGVAPGAMPPGGPGGGFGPGMPSPAPGQPPKPVTSEQ